MSWLHVIVGVCLLMSSCATPIDQLAATAATDIAQTKTAQPSITNTPTKKTSITSTINPSPIPSNTPIPSVTSTKISQTINTPIVINPIMTPVSEILAVELPRNGWCRASINHYRWMIYGNPYFKISMLNPLDDSYIFDVYRYPLSSNRTFSDNRTKTWEFKTFDEENYEIRYSSNLVGWKFTLVCEPYPEEE